MPNQLTAQGLQVSTQAEWLTYWTGAYQSIYGSNIVLTSDSPDGQMMNLLIQTIVDLQDFFVDIYNSFDPDLAFGATLDLRIAINGVQRQNGTYTITPITLVIGQSVSLYGLDQKAVGDPLLYTVSDNAGNQWYLVTTALGVSPGTYVYNFRAANPGAVLTVPNTINVPVTVILGVTSVNNPSAATTLGVNEEADGLVRLRRQRSVSLASTGFPDAVQAAVENVAGVASAFVYENDTAATDGDGVPGHSIWVIVAGSPTAADVASAIYSKRSGGCGTYGAQSHVITRANGSPFTVNWDWVTTQNVFIFFTATPIDGSTPPNLATIRTTLPTTLTPGANQAVNINQLGTLVQAIDPNTLVTAAGFSTGETQTLTLSAPAASGTVVLNYAGNATAAINWNDSQATIQSKLQAVSGLSALVVTGTLNGGTTLTLDLSGVSGGPQGLITATSNTLAPSGGGSCTVTMSAAQSSILATSSKKNQFAISSPNIIMLAMQLTQTETAVVRTTGTATFTGLGGYGAYIYSLSTNNSGGSINAATGAYTAGTTGNVTDTVKVTDTLGNTATATVLVT